MSNTLAIAAVTNALRNLLLSTIRDRDTALADLDVTTCPPDVARKNVTGTSLNLFLYQTVLNAAWRNFDMPRQVRPGEQGSPPLALNLHYLITAYGRADTDPQTLSHRVLGGAMSTLHDHPVLSASELQDALADNDLAGQIERVRVTPLSLSIDDMSKLWTTFQSNYRVSAAYEATVILIDSNNPGRAPLPVLRRGQQDRGVAAVAGAAPTLKATRSPGSQPAARLGEDVVVAGDNLQVVDALVRFTSLMRAVAGQTPLPPVVQLTPVAGDRPGEIKVQIADRTLDADAFARWAPGFYTVAQIVARAGLPSIVSNEVAFALAPTITLAPNSTALAASAPGDTLTIACSPRVRDGQSVIVVVGDQLVAPTLVSNPDPASLTYQATGTTITFELPSMDTGLYLVRLRVDGVDSMPVVLSGTPPVPSFDPTQQVRV